MGYPNPISGFLDYINTLCQPQEFERKAKAMGSQVSNLELPLPFIGLPTIRKENFLEIFYTQVSYYRIQERETGSWQTLYYSKFKRYAF